MICRAKRRLCLLMVLGLLGLAQAEPVVRVSSIDGPGKLEIKDGAAWHRAHVEMDAEQGDQLKTSDDTMASLRFHLGGRANLDKGTHVQIVSERDIKILKSGTFWGKIDSLKRGDEVRIQTAGGVMGIKGTEFVVTVDGDNTTLSLLEGEVEITPAQGEKYTARPGSKVQFGLGRELRSILMESEDSLREAAQTLREAGIEVPELREALRNPRARRKLRKQVREYRQEQGYASDPREQWGESDELLEDELKNLNSELFQLRGTLKQARQELRQAAVEIRQARREARQARREARAGVREARQALIDAGLSPSGFGLDAYSDALEEPENVPTPTVGEVKVLSSRPKLSWEEPSGENFVVMVLDESDDEEVHWLDITQSNSYQYPSDAKALSPGRYRYRVLPVDENGENPEAGVDYLFEVVRP